MTTAHKTGPVAGLEIGTSKICITVGELVEGRFSLLGLGQSRSRGVRKGEICTPETVAQDVSDALSEAEQMADVKIRSVFLGMTRQVVCGEAYRVQTAIDLLHAMGLTVDGLVFTGTASALALLTEEDKESGSLVIDLGGGATKFVVYAKGMVQQSGVLAVGGDHVSNDLAFGLKIPLSRAEKLKIELGSALVSDEAKAQQYPITDDNGCVMKTINVGYLQNIMSLRLGEIFGYIVRELEKAGPSNDLRAGVFLCGGVVRTPGITRLAETILRMPVNLGRIRPVGLTAAEQPEFATAIGLAQYGLAAPQPAFEPIPPPSPSKRGSTVPNPVSPAGRFSNTEPTRYDGEDLDVPTFVRRGGEEPTKI